MIRPILQAMVLADQVYEDKSTGKKVIAGTFNTLLFARRHPSQPPVNPAAPSASGHSRTPDATNSEGDASFFEEDDEKGLDDEFDEDDELNEDDSEDEDTGDVVESSEQDTAPTDVNESQKTPARNSDAKRVSGSNPHVQLIQQLRQAGSPSLYLSLTEVIGHIQLRLRYVDLDDNQVLFEIEMEATSSDPLRTMEYSLPLPSLPAPHAGVYVLELLFGEEPLGSLRITARETS